jgi:hypothetical protein
MAKMPPQFQKHAQAMKAGAREKAEEKAEPKSKHSAREEKSERSKK